MPLIPVKFPVSGRYHANYHPIAIHTAAQNDSEDCTSPMHCRILYHPAVYISHAHAPPPYTTHHNASSGTASLLPTPFSASPRQSGYDVNTKTHGHNSRDCGNKYTGGQNGNNNLRGQGGHGYQLNTHAPKSHNAQGGLQSHNNNGRCSGNAGADGYSHKYSTMSSRLPVQYNRRTAGSNVGSSAILRSGNGGYGSSQAAHKFNHATASNYGGSYKSSNAVHGYEYSTNGRARNYGDDQYYEINSRSMGNGAYGSTGRRNYLSNNNSYRGGPARLDLHIGSDNNGRPNNNDASKTDNAVVVVVTTSTTSTTMTTLSSRLSPAERANADASKDTQEKPASPPPAPYSPMTQPLPTLSPPTPQVQFYAPVQNRYQPSSMPSSQQQQQQQQQSTSNSQRSSRYSVGQTLANRKTSDKYSNATGSSQTTMLRQGAKYKVNGIMQTATTTVTSKLVDDNLGGAGDGPGRLSITPPGTPRAGGHPAAGDQNQLNDTCHQMQALTL